MTRTKKILISVLVVCASFSAIAYAQSETQTSASAITYPIAELGNCVDKGACRSYCNAPENISTCVAFAEARGLYSPEQARRANSFRAALTTGGPGQCKDPVSCVQYCSSVANMSECTAFARTHALRDETKLSEVEKVAQYLATGGTTPGNCRTRETCKAYCADFSHADECRAFSDAVGLSKPAGVNAVAPGQFQKVFALAKEGKTPGQCTSAETCRQYCADSTHRLECITFAQEAELLPPEKAQALAQSGFVGPGGCKSKEECRLYCNDQTHREECITFAKERGVISDEGLKIAQEGLVRLRAGLANAPEPVRACLRTTLGEAVLEQIQNGTFTPNQEVGEAVKKCFERFGQNSDVRQEIQKGPAPVALCIKEKLGEDLATGKPAEGSLTPEKADAIRACTEQHRLLDTQSSREQGTGPSNPSREPTAESFAQFLRNSPPAVSLCVKEKLGDRLQAVLSGQEPVSSTREVVNACMTAFKPQNPMPVQNRTQGGTSGTMQNFEKPMVDPSRMPGTAVPTTGTRPQFAPEIAACLKTHLSPTEAERALMGQITETSTREVLAKCFQQYNATQQQPAPSSINPFGAPAPVKPLPTPTSAVPSVSEYDLPPVDSFSAPDIEWGEESSVVQRAVASILQSILNFLAPNR